MRGRGMAKLKTSARSRNACGWTKRGSAQMASGTDHLASPHLVAWLAEAPRGTLTKLLQAVRAGRASKRDNCGLNRHDVSIDDICDSAAYVRKIQAIVAQGYNFARDIMVQFEKSNPTASKFSVQSWRRILADDRLDLDCWGTAVPRGRGP